MKKLFFFFLLINTVLFSQSKIYTLEESLETGLKNNKEIKYKKSQVEEAGAKINEISSGMLPNFSFNANYTRLSDIPPFEVTVPFSPQPIQIQESILNTYSLQLSFQQPLFTGFRLSSLKNAAEKRKLSAEELYSEEINNAALSIHEAFWNLYSAKKMVELLEERIASLKQHLKNTQNFLENGLATKNDLLKIQVRISNLELSHINAQNNFKLAEVNFNKQLGLELNSDSDIIIKIPEIKESPPDQDKLIEEAVEKRKELNAIDFQIEAAELNVCANKSDWYPNVALFGNYNYNRPNQRIMPLEDKFNDTWSAGVSLSWNIWDWGNTSSKVSQAKEQKFQLEIKKEELVDNIKTEVYKRYFDLAGVIKKVNVNKTSVDQAEENFRITQDKYNVQYATSSDLIDAETDLLEAEINLTTSLAEYELANIRLKKALGRKIY